jgi:hypothetical protein
MLGLPITHEWKACYYILWQANLPCVSLLIPCHKRTFPLLYYQSPTKFYLRVLRTCTSSFSSVSSSNVGGP